MSNIYLRGMEILTVHMSVGLKDEEFHIVGHIGGMRTICGESVAYIDREKIRKRPLIEATCTKCRDEYLRRVKRIILDFAGSQQPVTDFATDFEIEAQEAEERGLRWAPVIMWALAQVLREDV